MDALPDEFYSSLLPTLSVLHLDKTLYGHMPAEFKEMILEKIDWGYEFRLILSQ